MCTYSYINADGTIWHNGALKLCRTWSDYMLPNTYILDKYGTYPENKIKNCWQCFIFAVLWMHTDQGSTTYSSFQLLGVNNLLFFVTLRLKPFYFKEYKTIPKYFYDYSSDLFTLILCFFIRSNENLKSFRYWYLFLLGHIRRSLSSENGQFLK